MATSLSDAKVHNAKPKNKPYKIADGDGLFLLITPAGSKYWRLKYFFGGKEKLLALGVYPGITLADARERRAEAKKLLAKGADPGEAKKEAKQATTLKAANTFEAIAREWHEKRKHELAASSARTMLNHLERHIFPKLGSKPIADITAPEVLSVLRIIENRGTLDTARRGMQLCGQDIHVRHRHRSGRTQPGSRSRGALKTPVTKHRPYLQASELPAFLKKLASYDGTCKPSLHFASCCLHSFALPSYELHTGTRLTGTRPNGGFPPNA